MQEQNGVMMQFFHWYTPADGSLWTQLAERVADLAAAGVTAVWVPPAHKGAGGPEDTGYGAYDLFDLGEFDQKGSVRTKYGTIDQYLQAIRAAHAAGVEVYADIVLNHRLGADREEDVKATPYSHENHTEAIGELQPIRAWTHFTFPGRGTRYSPFQWHWWHFNAVDLDSATDDSSAVFLFEGKQFHDEVDQEKGNYDYLMGCNVDVTHPEVREELLSWGKWYVKLTEVDGFRFDAVKHVGAEFFVEWLDDVRGCCGRDLFAVGEYWSGIDEALERFLERTGGQMMLFDAGLHYSFAEAGRQGEGYDLRTVFDRSLVRDHPDKAVTLVSNHDTQPLQSLESVVEPWFKPLAYALILLRRGGYPCLFYPDYYGAEYTGLDRHGQEQQVSMPSHGWLIDRFLEARRRFAFGEEKDHFDDPTCIGWTRSGTEENPGGMAVVLSNAGAGVRSMRAPSPGTVYRDCTEHVKDEVVADEEGWAAFRCEPRSVSVWVPARTP
jgi:alpha-amylase